MTDPRNIRLVVGEIRDGLAAYTREQLVEILTYVFKEYVVDGATPLPTGAAAVLDARTELEGLSFAQLVTWLQQHLEVPELGLFEVQGERVSVRAGGRTIPLQAGAAEPVVVPQPVSPTPAPTPAETQTQTQTQTRTSTQTQTPTSTSTPTQTNPPASTSTSTSTSTSGEDESRFSRLELDD